MIVEFEDYFDILIGDNFEEHYLEISCFAQEIHDSFSHEFGTEKIKDVNIEDYRVFDRDEGKHLNFYDLPHSTQNSIEKRAKDAYFSDYTPS